MRRFFVFLSPQERSLAAIFILALCLGSLVWAVRSCAPAGDLTRIEAGPETAAGKGGAEAQGEKKEGDSVEPSTLEAKAEPGEKIYVHVCGAVQKPGVYLLPQEARVFQALERAGGALPAADLEVLNLAARLADADKLYVPRQGELAPAARVSLLTPPSGRESVMPGGDDRQGSVGLGGDSQKRTSHGPGGGGEGGDRGKLPAGKVNLNQAGLEELTTLPGIGPALAQRILEYRRTHGGFKRIEELTEVSGIGPKTLAKFRSYLTL